MKKISGDCHHPEHEAQDSGGVVDGRVFRAAPFSDQPKVLCSGDDAGISQRCFHKGSGWDTAKSLPWAGRCCAGPLRWGSPGWARYGAPARRAGLQRGVWAAELGPSVGPGVGVSRSAYLQRVSGSAATPPTIAGWHRWEGGGRSGELPRVRQLTTRSAGGCLAACAIFSDALLEASCRVRVDR